MCLLWSAAIDEAQAATDDYTVESRIENLITDWALINRAHNWDDGHADD